MNKILIISLLSLAILFSGCATIQQTTFLHPDFDFSFVEKIAVIPFENLSSDQGAGARSSRFFNSALLSSDAFGIVEPGEVTKVLATHSLVRTAELTQEQIITIGKELGVQGLFLGSVNESTSLRTGSTNVSVVTIVIRLVETETGTTVWSATNSADSQTFWSTFFGTGQKSISEVTRICIDGCLETLLY
jgi:polysaccharide biosynthesis protein PelC